MEFLDKIDDIIATEHKKIEDLIKKKFKEFKNQGRKPEFAIDETRTVLFETFIKTNFIDIYHSHFDTYYHLFKNSIDTYDNKQDAIKLVLQNEMYKAYLSFDKINKIPNHQYSDEFDNLTFENFVIYLLQYDTAKQIEALLLKNSDLYILFYKNDYSGDFYLKPFEGHVINSTIYKRLHKKFYPNEFIPYAKEETDEYNNIRYVIITEETEKNTPNGIKQIKNNQKKHDFNVDEQALLLNLCIADDNSIPTTEKIKLLILIGEIKDKSIFEGSSASNLFYQKVNKGVFRKGSSKIMLSIVDNVLNKIENIELNITKQRLIKHRITLVNEQNKTKNV
ncbi:hypothetical protein [Flavobacterium sp. HNIBRBA15423]|uniref:hypothetical protein n=1 Tax=Flavobacterium sp. HNIBRBA15423 TaxID=3458683 RepID=UPI004043D5BA